MPTLFQYLGTTEIKPTSENGQYKAKCPFKDCESKPNDYPFGINDTKKAFNCFHCGRNGDVLKFIMLRKECTFYEAKIFLLEWNRGTVRKEVNKAVPKQEDDPQKETAPKASYKPFRRELTGLRYQGHP